MSKEMGKNLFNFKLFMRRCEKQGVRALEDFCGLALKTIKASSSGSEYMPFSRILCGRKQMSLRELFITIASA